MNYMNQNSNLPFVSHIEFIRSNLPFLSAHVTEGMRDGDGDPGYMSRKIRKFRTDKLDT